MAQALVSAVDRDIVEMRIRELEDQLAVEKALLQRPAEPLGRDVVIRFTKYGSGYTFAALKVGGSNPFEPAKWFLTQDGSRTSRQGHPPKVWADLLTWIGERNWASIEVLS